MKVILVNMPWKCNGVWGVRAGSRWPHLKHLYSEKDYTPYPFFLGYATSFLRKNDIDAELIDAIAEQIEVPDFLKLINEKKPDLIVAETSTPSLNYDLSLIERLREIAPVALCGPEYNIRSLSFLEKRKFIDFVMVGEYEETLLELVRKLKRGEELSQVKGLIYRKDNRLYKNPPRGLIEDLDFLPWPYREGLLMENYVDAPGGMPLPCAQMWTSRGCPYKCIFCLWPQIMYQGNIYRVRNPYRVVDEMEYLIKELKFKSIYIDDDTANVNRDFLQQVAREIKKRRLKFPWAMMARPDLMDKELLKILRSAGLYAVKYGVESSEQKLLDNVNKNMNLEYALKMIEFTHKLGIKTHLTFTFGLPGETKETIEKTIKLALRLNPYSVQFSITTPFPGTAYFSQLKEKNWKEPEDWSLFDGHKAAVVKLDNLNSEDLENALEEAYRRWFKYKNKGVLTKTLWQEIKSFWSYTRLYGVKLALEKKNSYLNVKRQLKSERDVSGSYEKVSQRDEFLKGILEGKSAYSGPKVVVIDIANSCNLSCLGCWLHSPYLEKEEGEKIELKEELSLGTIKNLVDELHKLEVEEIQISGGGEPLVHPDFFEIIRYIKSKKIKTQLVTNFTLFDREKIDRVIDLGLDSITVSLWAGDSQTYLKVHPGVKENVFRKIEENLRYLLKRRKRDKPLVKIYNVIFKDNYKNITQMLDFALDVGVDYLEFQLLDPIPGKTDHLLISENEAREIEKIFSEFKKRYDYVSDFISEEDLLIFDSQEHREELFDFGRFIIKRNNEKFKLINGVRMAKCPQNNYSIKRLPLPEKDVRHIKYYFEMSKCRKCPYYKDCYKNGQEDAPFKADLLTIMGVGTFLRRVRFVSQGRINLDGSFVDTLPCYAGWYFARVTTEGDVKPCCKADDFIMGNINKNKFSDIWFSSSYDEFRYKSRILKKCDKPFPEIDCCKVCDNLGMNLLTHKFVLENIKPTDGHSSRIYYKNYHVIIPAQNFSRGNLNRKGSIFGQELVIDSGAGFGYAEYTFEIKKAAVYEIWSRYAAELPRSVEIRIDGKYLGKITKFTTGGWNKRHLKSFKECEFYFKKGKHTLELFCPSYFPHLERLELKPKLANKKGTFFCDSSLPYKKRQPFKLVQESFKIHGIIFTLKRILRYLKIRNFISNYLDIIGIFDGKIAYKGPFHVQIDLTNECNNNCIGCWCNSPLLEEKKMPSDVKKQYLPLEILKDTLNELNKIGTKEIYYSGGGEPFMHPNIMSVLKCTKDLNFTTYVNTNFTLLDRDKIDEIIDYNVDHFTVSIWAGTAETYARTHPNKTEATFYQIKENLLYLNRKKRERPYVKLYEVIFNQNYHEIKEMIEFARETGCEAVEFTLIDTIPGKTDKLALNGYERDRLFDICREIEDEMSSEFNYKGVYLFRFDQFLRRISNGKNVSHAQYDKNIIDSIPCYIGWLFARILPDGNVNPCLKSHRFPVGNIFEENFSAIWNSPRQIYFREKTNCYKKEDPFFRIIGNDPDTKEAGCYKSCDDIGRNLHMHKKIMSLTKLEEKFLKFISWYRKHKRQRNGFFSLYRKSLPKIDDKVVLGIIDGKRAYQGPEHVVIDITNRCQLKCVACWLYSPYLTLSKPSPEWLSKEIPFAQAKDLIKELSQMGTKIIRFTGGGEPLLYRGILDLLDFVKSRNIKACVTTNFYSLEDIFIKKLSELKIDEIAVSLWAGDAQTYIDMHPGTKKEDFIRLKENLKLFNSLKGNQTKVTLTHVITNKNHRHILKMAKFAQEVKANAVYFTLADVFPQETDFLLLKQQQYLELFQGLKDAEGYLKDSDIEIENLNGFRERIDSQSSSGHYDYKRIDRIPCYVGWYFTRILADGTVVPCCRGVKYPLGNINKDRFSDIWYSLAYNGFRSRAKYLKKSHPYFWKLNCYKECDNYMHNEEMHKRVISADIR